MCSPTPQLVGAGVSAGRVVEDAEQHGRVGGAGGARTSRRRGRARWPCPRISGRRPTAVIASIHASTAVAKLGHGRPGTGWRRAAACRRARAGGRRRARCRSTGPPCGRAARRSARRAPETILATPILLSPSRTAAFSAAGEREEVVGAASSRRNSSGSIPWPVTRKKPSDRQAASISVRPPRPRIRWSNSSTNGEMSINASE